jgi:hypothetical protein
MKLVIATTALASLIASAAFSPLAMGQQDLHETIRPQVERTFAEQAAAARAKLRPERTAAPPTTRPEAPSDLSMDRTTSVGIMASDPLLRLNVAYYNHSQALAKIAPQLPPDLRAQVERDIRALHARRQALLQIRQRNRVRNPTIPRVATGPSRAPSRALPKYGGSGLTAPPRERGAKGRRRPIRPQLDSGLN